MSYEHVEMRHIIVPEGNAVELPPAIINPNTIPIAICKGFDTLNQTEILQLNAASMMQFFGRGNIILNQNDIPNYYYVITDGYVLENYNDAKHVQHSFEILTTGFLFEKDVLFGVKKYTFSYKALTNVNVIRIKKQQINDLLQNITFKNYILDELNQEITNLRWRAINNTFSIETKVSQLLLTLCQKFGNPLFKLTNTDMANMLDSTRENVNKTLNKLWDKGLINMQSGSIFINPQLKDSL